MMRENPATLPMVLLSPFAPVVTLVNYLLEVRFAHNWVPRVIPTAGKRLIEEPAVEEVAA